MTESMPPAKQSHTVRNIIIGILIGLFACVICIGVVFAVTGGAILGVVNSLQAVGEPANGFMTALKNSDYATAYSLSDPEAQTAYGGSADAMRSQFVGLGLDKPTDWKFTNTDVTNNIATITGTVIPANGTSTNLKLTLRNSDSKWKVANIAEGDSVK